MFAELSTDFKKGAFVTLGVVAMLLILSLIMRR